ncbi:uncharacterized protein BT62DRAFT_1011366 [Guyanagaster necrorhizus]|uniref:Uncharacterized protein n=1 Tax=Guyanagaster necrorhizus TaxID=856835 RepID=A0A9P7VJ00_9AGAR|nr:uncharacterized protein BT62DRAFT_1011366 [Guyanagaster necrorhizus MCA 3950]KAG7441564.1 hypothetical protein BT62DRAFT_1011366 [Guyanagaster necrorhizus MCA 3950]
MSAKWSFRLQLVPGRSLLPKWVLTPKSKEKLVSHRHGIPSATDYAIITQTTPGIWGLFAQEDLLRCEPSETFACRWNLVTKKQGKGCYRSSNSSAFCCYEVHRVQGQPVNNLVSHGLLPTLLNNSIKRYWSVLTLVSSDPLQFTGMRSGVEA